MDPMNKLKDKVELKAKVKQRQRVAIPAGIIAFIAALFLISRHPEWGMIYEIAILPAGIIGCAVYFAVMVLGMKRLS